MVNVLSCLTPSHAACNYPKQTKRPLPRDAPAGNTSPAAPSRTGARERPKKLSAKAGRHETKLRVLVVKLSDFDVRRGIISEFRTDRCFQGLRSLEDLDEKGERVGSRQHHDIGHDDEAGVGMGAGVPLLVAHTYCP